MDPHGLSRFKPVRYLSHLKNLPLVLLPGLLLAGCDGGVLDPQGPIGAAEKTILLNALGVMMLIVAPVIIATLAFAYWYRASNTKAVYWPDWEYSGRLEFIVWAIPALMILFLGGVTWVGSHDLDPRKPISDKGGALEVQVVSLDWKWLFIYPQEGVASVNRLVVPAGKPVHFTLTSATVMNTFFIPQLGGMIYTMAGMATDLNLQADTPGTYYGTSAHYSGDGFSDMHFDVIAKPDSEYRDWVQSVKGKAPVLDKPAYDALEAATSDNQPKDFGGVETGLFRKLVMQTTGAAQTASTQLDQFCRTPSKDMPTKE